ncbi:T9SS type A sorting domain-containing protein [Flammeovirga aprica]|uniref:T9SS type A sorting domain-containing protein n=1 Tax=Flammeovirga aprica JL-4 TaxID=694437 RepID=A0A7X9P219_9BACT|nr:T9SS type A sorting domain-containing protein [Flammeovirga aprica]NME66972.1 T9SS type A sorting domain-containing protein [Flammeovirga aprica JL-4]
MRAIYPLLLTGALGFITMNSYGQCNTKWNTSLSITDNVTMDSDGSCVYGTGASDLTYSLANGGRTLTIDKDVTIDVGEFNTFAITGSNLLNNFTLQVNEGATLTINGNFRMNYHCDLILIGNLIVKGDLNTAGWDFFMNFDLGDNAVLAVEGDANFNRGYGSNKDRIYVLGESSSVGGGFDAVNVGSDPFSTTQSLDFNALSASINFWDESKLVEGDRSGNKVSVYILSELTVNTASGWYGKYLRVKAFGFDNNEIDLPNQASLGTITSLQDLKDRIATVKWEVKNNTVKDKLDHYHDNGKTNTNHLTKEENSTMQDYFSQNRKIVIEFVDSPSDAKAVYESYPSNARMSAVQNIEEIEIENDMGDLPIILSSFSIRTTDQQTVELKWTSAMEINNDYYEVFRSVNQTNWESIGTMDGAGNTNYAIDYTFIDEQPLPEAYYKLVQYDFDGQNEAYGPLFVTLKGDTDPTFQAKLYPNVLHRNEVSNLSIQGASAGADFSIEVINNQGNTIYQEVIENLAGSSILKPLNLPSKMPSGMYYMIVKSGRKVVKNKLILQ